MQATTRHYKAVQAATSLGKASAAVQRIDVPQE
jgi:hypothetical protein